MRRLNQLLVASSALTCLYTAPAIAAGPPDPYSDPGFYIALVGGGATFPSIVYREILDCNFHPMGYGNVTGPGPMPGTAASAPGIPAGQTINSNCPSYPFGGASNLALYYHYAPTGSGNGKAALKANNNNALTNPITTSIPYTSQHLQTYPYPQAAGYHFSGSDDVWNLQDQIDWNVAGGPASKFGNMIQFPTVAGAVTIVLNGKDGAGTALNQNGATVTGASSKINLTRQAACGIFSGHITKWNNAILTAQNGGVAMGTGQITVVHRFDGSGTNFLLTNGLQEQCRAISGPNSETDTTIVSYAFPWGDHSVCPAVPRGANQVNWPDQFPTVCGAANPAPTGSAYTNAGSNGSQALVNTVQATNGAVGYVSPDFAQPVNPSGPITANLQDEWDVSTNATGTPTFVAPTVAATTAAVSSVTPVFDSTTIGNPLAWSLQGVVPNPNLPGAYPLAGFTWLEMYQCYNSGNNIPVQIESFLYTLYAGGKYGAIINSNGFATVPNVWLTQINNLLNNASFAPSQAGSGACTGKVGAT